jgi:endoglucanase
MILQKYFISLRILLIIVALANLTSTAVFSNDTLIVEKHGQLRVEGNKIVDKNGDPVALHGMCLYWSQWKGQFYNYDCVQWLRDDWKCTVVRAACGINGTTDGYLVNPQAELAKIKTVIDACIDLGIYVIVDWHDHNAQNHLAQSISFFEEIASEYNGIPNIIYEIYNEPLQVSWSTVVKPYADSVVKCIRAIDSVNLIIVGTPTWSQDVDVAANSPLAYQNIAYALHFYAATHKKLLRDKATTALSRGVALFVSEFGTTTSNGSGTIDSAETDTWMKFMNDNKLVGATGLLLI